MQRNSHKRQLYDCSRCMFTYKKSELRKQRGMLLCSACFDSVLEIAPLNMKFLSPRENSTTTTAVNTPTIFVLTTAGVTALSQSQVHLREGVRNNYVMYVSGSPTTITANPQIVAGSQGTLLTLVGTSDTNYVVVSVGNGTDLAFKHTLKNGNTLSLVYNSTSARWCETSRS